jgi:hypothetical protein
MADLPEYVKGELKEDGQTLDFPILRDGILTPAFRAGYHVQGGSKKDYEVSEDLLYLALPSGIKLELEEIIVPAALEVNGEITDVKKFMIPHQEKDTTELSIAKINPGMHYRLSRADDTKAHGDILYHSFEMLETPDCYKNPDYSDFVTLPDGSMLFERPEQITKMTGAMIFPKSCAFRIPGWLTGYFNGSPEFGFAYSPFKEPRKGEVLHYHQEIMEPYMGIEGRTPLFIETEEGSDKLETTDLEGKISVRKGEMIEMGKGDVMIPLPRTAHRILFDERTNFPFTQYCINYAAKHLNEVPKSDRVILERKKE